MQRTLPEMLGKASNWGRQPESRMEGRTQQEAQPMWTEMSQPDGGPVLKGQYAWLFGCLPSEDGRVITTHVPLFLVQSVGFLSQGLSMKPRLTLDPWASYSHNLRVSGHFRGCLSELWIMGSDFSFQQKLTVRNYRPRSISIEEGRTSTSLFSHVLLSGNVILRNLVPWSRFIPSLCCVHWLG